VHLLDTSRSRALVPLRSVVRHFTPAPPHKNARTGMKNATWANHKKTPQECSARAFGWDDVRSRVMMRSPTLVGASALAS